jgi:hypothetical protein
MRLAELGRVPFHVLIHKVGIAFLSGSNASIFDLVQLLESSSFNKPVSLAWIMDKKSKE